MQAGSHGCQNKHKAHRANKKSGYYKNQFQKTSMNKLRRALARKRRLATRPKQ